MNKYLIFSLCTADVAVYIYAITKIIKDQKKYKRLLASDTGKILFDIKPKKIKIEKVFAVILGIILALDKFMAITEDNGVYITGATFLFIVWICQYGPEFYVFSKKIKYKNPKGYGGKEGEASPEDILSITTTDKESLLSVVYITLKTNEEVAVPTSPKGIEAVKEFCRTNLIELDG